MDEQMFRRALYHLNDIYESADYMSPDFRYDDFKDVLIFTERLRKGERSVELHESIMNL